MLKNQIEGAGLKAVSDDEVVTLETAETRLREALTRFVHAKTTILISTFVVLKKPEMIETATGLQRDELSQQRTTFRGRP